MTISKSIDAYGSIKLTASSGGSSYSWKKNGVVTAVTSVNTFYDAVVGATYGMKQTLVGGGVPEFSFTGVGVLLSVDCYALRGYQPIIGGEWYPAPQVLSVTSNAGEFNSATIGRLWMQNCAGEDTPNVDFFTMLDIHDLPYNTYTLNITLPDDDDIRNVDFTGAGNSYYYPVIAWNKIGDMITYSVSVDGGAYEDLVTTVPNFPLATAIATTAQRFIKRFSNPYLDAYGYPTEWMYDHSNNVSADGTGWPASGTGSMAGVLGNAIINNYPAIYSQLHTCALKWLQFINAQFTEYSFAGSGLSTHAQNGDGLMDSHYIKGLLTCYKAFNDVVFLTAAMSFGHKYIPSLNIYGTQNYHGVTSWVFDNDNKGVQMCGAMAMLWNTPAATGFYHDTGLQTRILDTLNVRAGMIRGWDYEIAQAANGNFSKDYGWDEYHNYWYVNHIGMADYSDIVTNTALWLTEGYTAHKYDWNYDGYGPDVVHGTIGEHDGRLLCLEALGYTGADVDVWRLYAYTGGFTPLSIDTPTISPDNFSSGWPNRNYMQVYAGTYPSGYYTGQGLMTLFESPPVQVVSVGNLRPHGLHKHGMNAHH